MVEPNKLQWFNNKQSTLRGEISYFVQVVRYLPKEGRYMILLVHYKRSSKTSHFISHVREAIIHSETSKKTL